MGVEMGITGVMDVSEELGWIVGENVPDGNVFINPNSCPYIDGPLPRFPIPRTGHRPAISAVWIAKKRYGGVAETNDAAAAVGNSLGFVSILKISHSKSANEVNLIDSWCICPGVPIVEIKVDEEYIPARARQKKPWIMVVNAIGEVYYLRQSPDAAQRSDWKMIHQTRRKNTFVYEKMFPTPENVSQESDEARRQRQANNEKALLNIDYLTLTTLFENVRMDWFIEVDFPSTTLVIGRPTSGSQPADSFSPPESPLRRYSLPGDGDGPAETHTDAETWNCAHLKLPQTHTLITCHTLDLSKPALAAPKTTWTPGHSARLLAIGTNASSIHIYNIRAPVSHSRGDSATVPVIQPLRSIITSSPSITTLALTAVILVHGGSDGLVQAWDPLASTSPPLRTLHSKFSAKARRRIEQVPSVTVNNNAFAARCLSLDPDPTVLRGVVALGSFIRYWSFSTTDSHLHSKRSRKRQSPTGGALGRRKIGNSGNTTGRIGKDVKTEQADLKAEEEAREKERRLLERRFGVGEGGLGLDDEEMVAYAEMISKEMAEKEEMFMRDAGVLDQGVNGHSSSSASSSRLEDAPPAAATPDVAAATSPAPDLDEYEDPEIAEAIRRSILEQQQQQEPSSSSSLTPNSAPAFAESSFSSSQNHYTTSSSANHLPLSNDTTATDWPVFIRSPKPNKQRKGKGKGKAARQGEGSSAGSSGSWGASGGGYHRQRDVGGDQDDEDLQLAIRLSLMEAEGRV